VFQSYSSAARRALGDSLRSRRWITLRRTKSDLGTSGNSRHAVPWSRRAGKTNTLTARASPFGRDLRSQPGALAPNEFSGCPAPSCPL